MGGLVKEHGEVEVEIDGAVYTLKRWLGWWDLTRASETKGVTIHVRGRELSNGNIGNWEPDELVPVTMDASEDALLRKLRTFLLRWSHDDPITDRTLKLIPPRHFNRLIREIRRLENDQGGPSDDGPLADSSKPTFAESSSSDAPTS